MSEVSATGRGGREPGDGRGGHASASARGARPPALCGIVLAAGAGTRRGGPKALVRDADGPWLESAVRLLLDGGCHRVVVVLGAGAQQARALLPVDAPVDAVVAEAWAEGMGESLRTGLARATGEAAVVTLVDLPGTPTSVVHRLLRGGVDGRAAAGPTVDGRTLRQATYDGRPGHPVVLGREHWVPLAAGLRGDVGARPYLRTHGVEEVECGDLHHGRDVDT